MGKPDVLRHTERDSRIELLRIVAMLIIVMCHFVGFHWLEFYDRPNWKAACGYLAMQGGQVGVAVFFVITGYFMVMRTGKPVRIAKVWPQSFIYSVGLSLVMAAACLFGLGKVGNTAAIIRNMGIARIVVNTIFPILSNEYWFIAAYMVLMLLSPVFKIMFERLPEGYNRLFIIGLLFSSLLPVLGFAQVAPFTRMIYAITCYLIGGYIRIYRARIRRIPSMLIVSVLVPCLLGSWALNYAGVRQGPMVTFLGLLQMLHSDEDWLPTVFTMILIGAGTFVLVLNSRWKPFDSRFIVHPLQRLAARFIRLWRGGRSKVTAD